MCSKRVREGTLYTAPVSLYRKRIHKLYPASAYCVCVCKREREKAIPLLSRPVHPGVPHTCKEDKVSEVTVTQHMFTRREIEESIKEGMDGKKSIRGRSISERIEEITRE